jgi:hypothetical protein
MEREPHSAISHRLIRLASKLRDKIYRDSFVGARCRRFLAHQVRALRGEMSQSEFGKLIEKPQSVVSRLEDPSYGKMTLNSLLDVAAKTDRALLVQFVDWKVLLKMSADDSEESSAPAAYNQIDIQSFAQAEALKDAAIGLQPVLGAIFPLTEVLARAAIPRWNAPAGAQIQNWVRSIQAVEFNNWFNKLELPNNSIDQIIIRDEPHTESESQDYICELTQRAMIAQRAGLSQ